MTRAVRSLALLGAVLAATTACSAVHSDAVRELIALEGQKIKAASTQVKTFRAETDERVQALAKARADLDVALRQQQASEHVHALVFGSNQNVRSKTGVDAHAVAYMIGQIYLAEHSGLEKTVREQFEADSQTLRTLAKRLDGSWQSIQKLHAEVERFAGRSGLASVDAALLRAVAEQVTGGTEQLDASLRKARHVNELLEKALATPALGGDRGGPIRSTTQDLIDLLDRVKR